MPKYSLLIKTYGKFLLPRISRPDGGFKDPVSKEPRSFYTSNHLCDVFNRVPNCFLRDITKTDLTNHVDNRMTLYYRADWRAEVATFMGDIDAHNDETDALQLFQWLERTYFPGVYSEPSTGGRGVHFYLHVRVGPPPRGLPTDGPERNAIKGLLKQLANALREAAVREGFRATFCGICGTYTICQKDEQGRWKIERNDRGILGKIPRLPGGQEDLRRLVDSPVFEIKYLHELIHKLSCHDATPSAVLPAAPMARSPLDSQKPIKPVNGPRELYPLKGPPPAPRPPGNTTTQPTTYTKDISVLVAREGLDWQENPKLLALYQKALRTAHPLPRMRLACSLYYHIYMQYPVPEALVSFYEQLGLQTGEARGEERLVRAKMAVERHQGTCQEPSTLGFKLEEWLPLVQQYITEDIRRHPAIKYAFFVEETVLAACLYLLTLNAFKDNRADRMHSCDDKAQAAFYKVLADAEVLRNPVKSKHKRVAAVQMLQLGGLVVLRDAEFHYGGKFHGVGKKYGLGMYHPRFREFVKRFGHVVDPKNLSFPSSDS